MKPSKVIGGVVGVGIVLLIIIGVSWLVLSNGTKPIADEPNANKTLDTTTILPSTEATPKTSLPSKPTEKDNTNDTSPATTTVSSYSTDKNKVEDVDNATTSPHTSTTTTDQSKKYKNFFIHLDALDIWTQSYSAKNDTITKIEITDSPGFSSNFTKEVYNTGFTSDCSNKRIYILKKSNSSQSPEQVLDVIQYDDNNKFQTINRVHSMFNEATAIASDWTTGNLYWIEHINDNKFAIKVTNKSFNKTEYVVQPSEGRAGNHIQFYPKEKKIFFSNGTHIWYVFTLPNSTPKLLYPSSTNDGILDFAIDYALDKLYWLTFFDLKCIRIGDPLRPDNIQVISQETSNPRINLAVFNKTFLFNREEDHPVLSMKNGNVTSKLVAYNVTGESSLSPIFTSKLFFFPQECIV